ncbi:MAG: response regulator [Acidobacteria bacterium]|nr:response regulator [Acidobacteriota bacterium]
MTRKPVRVLLVEDNPVDFRLLSADFVRIGPEEFELKAVTRLSEAVRVLGETGMDVVLLDLFLEDASGLEALARVRQAAPDAPIVVLTGLADEDLALQALKHGAQDYLMKGTVDTRTVFRAIRYAIERKSALTERRLLEQRLLEKQKLEAIGTLSGGVAHNFNNILTIILGHCNLMLERMDSDNVNRASIEAIKKAGERAAVLTRQLLAFNRGQTLRPALFDLNEIVLNMQHLLESVLGEAITLRLDLPPHLGFVRVDRSQIEQVLMNMAMNARDAMPDGGALTIATAASDSQVVLTIRDTGCGMTAETCSHVFEPFFTTKGLARASGLGLSTVYGLVNQNGGSIDVASAPGAGTAFSVSFPVGAAAKSVQCQPETIPVME